MALYFGILELSENLAGEATVRKVKTSIVSRCGFRLQADPQCSLQDAVPGAMNALGQHGFKWLLGSKRRAVPFRARLEVLIG